MTKLPDSYEERGDRVNAFYVLYPEYVAALTKLGW